MMARASRTINASACSYVKSSRIVQVPSSSSVVGLANGRPFSVLTLSAWRSGYVIEHLPLSAAFPACPAVRTSHQTSSHAAIQIWRQDARIDALEDRVE